jgi:hypothetical protein
VLFYLSPTSLTITSTQALNTNLVHVVTSTMRASRLQTAFGSLLRPVGASTGLPTSIQTRWAHKNASPRIPATIPFVPNVETFLTLIGRRLRGEATKFPTWESLFTLTSDQLRELGVEPARTRKYLLRWRKRYQEGKYGIGGDFQHVENGRAELKILEDDSNPLYTLRKVINVPTGQSPQEVPEGELVRPEGYKVQGVKTIIGPYALPAPGGGAHVVVTEGMWEDKRGRKIDGGERRKAQVRFLRGVKERRALKEKQGFY